jgi:hypothetical protein
LRKRFAHCKKIRIVDREHSNPNVPDRRSTGQLCSRPLEVIAPEIESRMEEAYDLTIIGICSGNVGAFVAVAGEAGERQIFENGLTSMLPGDDVVGVEGQGIEGRGKVTVLAPVPCALPDLSGNLPVHE